jgi:hypothetical protein
LNRKIQEREPRTQAELRTAITEAIEELNAEEPQHHYFRALYASMPKRLRQVVEAGGLPTLH